MNKKIISLGLIAIFGLSISTFTYAQTINGCIPGAKFNIYTGQACVTTPQSTSCLDLPTNLSRGMRNVNMTKLQSFLKAQGDLSQSVILSTMFGPATQAAVKKFQLRTRVVANAFTPGYGNVGPKTRAMIKTISCTVASIIPGGSDSVSTIPGTTSTVLGQSPTQPTTPVTPSTPTTPTTPSAPSPSVPSYPAGTILTPGSGFSGVTPQPVTVGSGSGSDAKAIARWDVVPHQTFEGNFNVGVVAFHINDIDRVEFSVNGGSWTAIRDMTVNPQTNVKEYWATVRASDFQDGQLEVRATAYPKVGIPRVLQGSTIQRNGENSLTLFANSRGTLLRPTLYVSLYGSDTTGDGTNAKPYASISKALDRIKALGTSGDGAIVTLKDAGTYAGPNRGAGFQNVYNTRFVTIQPAAGLTKEQVIIGNPVRATIKAGVSRLHWKGVSMDLYTIGQFYNGTNWFDSVTWFSSGNMVALSVAEKVSSPTNSPSFMTDSEVKDTLYGTTNQMLVRNTKLVRVFGDAFQNSLFVVNSSLHDMINLTPHHTDIYQMFGAMDNLIVYNTVARNVKGAQAIFLEPTFYSTIGQPQNRLTNAAFIDVDFEITSNPENPPYSQMMSQFEHMLFKNVKISNQRFIPRSSETNNQAWFGKNIVLEDFTTYNYAPYALGEIAPGMIGRLSSARGDTQAPSAPTDITANVLGVYIRIGWSPSTDNKGIVKYAIRKDGMVVGNVDATETFYNHRSTVTTSLYTVVAYDAAGNVSAAPTPVSVSSVAADVTAPVRSAGAPSGTLSADSTSTTITLTTNESATCKYSTTPNISFVDMTSTLSASGGASHSASISGLRSGISYNYHVRCQDAARNVNSNDFSISFSVANAPASPISGPSQGLVAYHTFNSADQSGTTAFDSSGTGNNATLNGGAGIQSGLKGDALVTNGSGQFASIPFSSSLGGMSSLTLSAWVNLATTSIGSCRHVIGAGSGSNDQIYQLSANGSKRWSFGIKNSNATYFTLDSGVIAQSNTWVHLAGVYNGSALEMYVNGVKSANSTPASGTLSSESFTRYIGRKRTFEPRCDWVGSIDDVRIYNRALSGSEIQQLAQ